MNVRTKQEIEDLVGPAALRSQVQCSAVLHTHNVLRTTKKNVFIIFFPYRTSTWQ